MSIPDFETLLYAVDDGVAVITLNRPDRLNAFTVQMRDELTTAFDRTDADAAVRAMVVTGAGRAFCAGADPVAGGNTFDYAKQQDPRREAPLAGDVCRDGRGQVTLRIFRSLKPVIGAIHGAALGIGATLRFPMDVRLASMQARFGFVFARRGITPEAASSWFLPRLVGMQTALQGAQRPGVRRRRCRGVRPGMVAAPAGSAAGASLRFGARDDALQRTRLGRPDPPAAVAHGRYRPPHDRPSPGQPRHPVPLPVR
jgi:enoyl-CoA hydratase/carnithine racemase